MDAETILFEKHLKKTAIVSNSISIVVALIVALSVGYGFYYNTNSTLDEHTTDIKEVKENVKEVNEQLNEINVYKGVSTTELKSLEEKVEKMDVKLDRLLYQTR
jgi:uncharacterized protein YwgA